MNYAAMPSIKGGRVRALALRAALGQGGEDAKIEPE